MTTGLFPRVDSDTSVATKSSILDLPQMMFLLYIWSPWLNNLNIIRYYVPTRSKISWGGYFLSLVFVRALCCQLSWNVLYLTDQEDWSSHENSIDPGVDPESSENMLILFSTEREVHEACIVPSSRSWESIADSAGEIYWASDDFYSSPSSLKVARSWELSFESSVTKWPSRVSRVSNMSNLN